MGSDEARTRMGRSEELQLGKHISPTLLLLEWNPCWSDLFFRHHVIKVSIETEGSELSCAHVGWGFTLGTPLRSKHCRYSNICWVSCFKGVGWGERLIGPIKMSVPKGKCCWSCLLLRKIHQSLQEECQWTFYKLLIPILGNFSIINQQMSPFCLPPQAFP